MKNILPAILAVLGIGCSEKVNNDEQSMILWEDDYLMIEIMSNQNLEYAQHETTRINEFGKEHSDGLGFNAVTEIKKKKLETKDLKIETRKFVKIFDELKTQKYQKLLYYGGGEPKEIKDPNTLVYGKHKTGIFIEEENGLIENIWFNTYNWEDLEKTKINLALKKIGDKYDMIMVDFFKGEIINLKNQYEIDKYLQNE